MRSKTATRLANRSVVAVILVCLMLFSVSIGTASGASHNVRRARPNATWVSAWDWGTWVWSGPPCNCYYHPVLAWDSNVVNPVLIINANLNLSRPLTLEPTGVAVSGVSLFTYTRRNAIVYDAVYSLSSDKTTAKLVRTIKPPGGADGVTIDVEGGNGLSPMQTISYSKGGAPVGQSYSVPIGEAIDTVVQRKAPLTCSGGYISPPIVLEPTVANLKTGSQSAGRATPMPCNANLPNHVTVR